MVEGHKEKGKFHPHTSSSGKLSSSQVDIQKNEMPIDSSDLEALKNKKSGMIHNEPIVGYINRHPVTLSIELRERKEKQKGTDLKIHQKPVELGISAGIWNLSRTDINQGGQSQDTIREALNDGTLKLAGKVTKSDMKRFLDIWDRWHLNGLIAGTTRQNELIEKYKNHSDYKHIEDYHDKVNEILARNNLKFDNGYEWGSEWLYESLPKDVIDFVKDFQKKIGET